METAFDNGGDQFTERNTEQKWFTDKALWLWRLEVTAGGERRDNKHNKVWCLLMSNLKKKKKKTYFAKY